MPNAAEPRVTSFPKSRIKILLLEGIHRGARDAFAEDGFDVELCAGALSEDELVRRIADVHVLGIRSKTHLTARVIDAGRRLLSLGCFCIGTNQVDLAHANARGLPVFNAPFSNTRSVAEMMLAEIIMLARKLGDRNSEIHAGMWRKEATGCHEIRGKVLGIVGYGHIGRQMGVLAEAVGLRVLFFDTANQLPMGNNQPVGSLDELLAAADFVTLHVPATPQTHHMIGASELRRMRPGSYLLNASRGTVVELEALAEALRAKQLAGAAIDVYPEEPQSNGAGFESPLRGLPNVVLTPHIGGSTEEAQAMIGREVASALIKFINVGSTAGSVNFPQVELPPNRGTHRLLNVHKNVPGVLRDINRIASDLQANIHSQVLATDSNIGYLIMDLEQDVSHAIKTAVRALDTSIRTRILY